MSERRQGRSLFWMILVPQFFVLAIVIIVLMFSMPVNSTGEKITQNYQDVIALQTENQGEYLEIYLNDNRMEVSALSETLSAALQKRIDNGTSLEKLTARSSSYVPLLTGISDNMISTLHSGHASGVFVVLYAGDPTASGAKQSAPCVYIRDEASNGIRDRSDDLVILFAPESVCSQLDLTRDENWQPLLQLMEPEQQAFFYDPLLSARESCSAGDTGELYGRWTLMFYQREDGMKYALSYSEPIILEDGTVAGVVGIELLPERLGHFLPSGSLLKSDDSGFILALSNGDQDSDWIAVVNGCGAFLQSGTGDSFALTKLQSGGFSLMNNNREFYTDVVELEICDQDAVPTEQKWYLVGVVGMNEMFAFANEITRAHLLTILLTLLVGIVSAITVSRRLAKPISALSAEISGIRSGDADSVQFTETGIEEIDDLSDAFRALLQETVDTSTKFLSIMELASVELAGYEWREGSDSVYVTDNFFPMLGVDNVDVSNLSVEEFNRLLDEIRAYKGKTLTMDGSRIYSFNRGGQVRYVRAESAQDGERHVGLLEDVTRSTLERIRVEHERDYDVLTGLYNRRAFYHRAGQLFANQEELHNAALMVLDMDNLKSLNDRYGHDYGDKYLRQTAQCIMESTPGNALCARISGDELYVLLHGYKEKIKLREDIERLMRGIRQASLQLPNDETIALSVSGGIAVYPEDSRNLTELVKYADFTMYQAKNSSKGFVLGFNPAEYAKNETFIRGRGELRRLIEQENVRYHFQPIFSAEDARPAAYEALMRVDMPSIKSPDVVLRLAAAEGSQYQIERITMFKASETYRSLLENGQVADDAMLFINSLPDQCLSEKDAQKFHEQFKDLQSRIVLEITEDEYLGLDALEVKRSYPGFSGNFALDDYGSGYNGEKNLLLLQPRFVKVDVVFIRGIDSNSDRQQLVSSLVTYAHGRNMKVVAEGIETAEELQKVLELGVDLFQGYFLARPAAVPGAIAPQAEEIIKKFRREISE